MRGSRTDEEPRNKRRPAWKTDGNNTKPAHTEPSFSFRHFSAVITDVTLNLPPVQQFCYQGSTDSQSTPLQSQKILAVASDKCQVSGGEASESFTFVCACVCSYCVCVCVRARPCEWERVKIEDGFAGLQLIIAGPPGSPYHALAVTHAGHSGSCARASPALCREG